MTIFDVDSVVSIQEELAYCYQHHRFGLKPVQDPLRRMRIERNAVYKENSALYLTRTDVIRSGRLVGEKIGHINMLPWESIKINSEYEFWLAERIISDWDKKPSSEDSEVQL